MTTTEKLSRLDYLTFKGNLKHTRYGWLRLTPAYSVHLVANLLDRENVSGGTVLDPFCGTGTTALVCAERGFACDTTDINPFLLWLTRAKTRSYTTSDVESFRAISSEALAVITRHHAPEWFPLLYQIEKWWAPPVLAILGRIMWYIRGLESAVPAPALDLLKVTFCRVMIECSHVSFGHQSMSFKTPLRAPMFELLYGDEERVCDCWERAASDISTSALTPIAREPRPLLSDARLLNTTLEADNYSCVITSPPYPNRMSYIRELRPYMYWLGYLADARSAGELDWQAIGGTWGRATSNLGKWKPDRDIEIPYARFHEILDEVAARSSILSKYLNKYFYDMALHVHELYAVVKPGGAIHYIIGNSKFYDVMVPTEEIFASLFQAAGFQQTEVKVIRKRTSKRELYEYVVSAKKPAR